MSAFENFGGEKNPEDIQREGIASDNQDCNNCKILNKVRLCAVDLYKIFDYGICFFGGAPYSSLKPSRRDGSQLLGHISHGVPFGLPGTRTKTVPPIIKAQSC